MIVFAFGMSSSGIPSSWAASHKKPGLNIVDLPDTAVLEQIKEHITKMKGPTDLLIASIHWGGNWGYQIPEEQIELAHILIDEAGFDVIHGH